MSRIYLSTVTLVAPLKVPLTSPKEAVPLASDLNVTAWPAKSAVPLTANVRVGFTVRVLVAAIVKLPATSKSVSNVALAPAAIVTLSPLFGGAPQLHFVPSVQLPVPLKVLLIQATGAASPR